jgi:Icc-related predicted phosphoesterase
MRIAFFTDVHGSTLVFEKGLSMAEEFDVDLLILGGDLSGKRLLDIERLPSGDFVVYEPYTEKGDRGDAVTVYRARDVRSTYFPALCQRLEAKGYYWFVGDNEELGELNSDSGRKAQLERDAIMQRLMHWTRRANERLPEHVECVWTGGNDDEQDVLDQLRNQDLGRFTYGEGQLHGFDEYQILSLGVSNPTPFDTAREYPEPQIAAMLELAVRGVTNPDMLLLNVHVPPINCGDLDLAMDTKEPHRLIHVGSTAVRDFIIAVRPLADFAGHVHERRGAVKIGRTTVFNAGSDYNSGILQAFIVDLDYATVRNYMHVLR